jgi:hypothetical protein
MVRLCNLNERVDEIYTVFNNTVDVEREYNKSAWILLKFTDYARDEERET